MATTKNLGAVLLVLAAGSCAAHPAEVPSFDGRGNEANESTRDAVSGWKCDTTGGGTQVSPQGRYYATSFGCWLDEDGKHRGDPNDNCIPYCIDSVCNGKSGRDCEESIKWFAAGERRYGCGTRLRVTNPKNDRSVVVMVIDRGPRCSIEDTVDHWVADLSYPAMEHLFGEDKSPKEKALVVVQAVAGTTELGPTTTLPEESKQDDPSGCGALSYAGQCSGNAVQFCEGDAVKTLDCAAGGLQCGWNEAKDYFDCLSGGASGGSAGNAGGTGGGAGSGAGGCGALTYVGECTGDTLRYCDNGQVRTVECAAVAAACGYDSAQGYYDCIKAAEPGGTADQGCGSVDFTGQCQGKQLSYCDGGALVTVDCGANGMVCGWSTQAGYFDCL